MFGGEFKEQDLLQKLHVTKNKTLRKKHWSAMFLAGKGIKKPQQIIEFRGKKAN